MSIRNREGTPVVLVPVVLVRPLSVRDTVIRPDISQNPPVFPGAIFVGRRVPRDSAGIAEVSH
jgi:hypothetical protein